MSIARQAACIAAVVMATAVSLASADEAAKWLSAEPLPTEPLFTEHVEPILRERCYGCHSHAAGVIEGGLALDWKSGWAEGGSRGPAIIPGDPEASLLIRAIRHVDPDLSMPDDQLPDHEIATLVNWVAGGAVDPRSLPAAAMEDRTDWWSLRPLTQPEVPAAAAECHPVDAFVDTRLAEAGLASTMEADRRTLIRRLTIDLHGLPPTPADVEAFVADRSPDAYSQLLDRLLASPRYGEQWARHWLDTIHFADTHGFEHDAFRPNAWRYRDYVIASFNADLPWDRFVKEQCAADVFAPEATDRRVALGYLGAGPYDHSAAITAPRSFEHLDRDDLVTQTMGAFASTTASCARCHAHKFDPISQDDYYALQAVFAGIGKGDVAYDPDPQTARDRQRWEQLAAAAQHRDETVLLAEEHAALVAAWEAARGDAAAWLPLELETISSAYGATLHRQADGSILVEDERPEVDVTTLVAKGPATITAIRLEVLADDSLPAQGPGRADNGNLHLNEVAVEVRRPAEPLATPVAIGLATADFNQEGWTIAQAIDGDPKTAWGIHPAVGQSHQAVFTFAEPLVLEADAQLTVVLRQIHGGSHLIGRLRLTVTDGDPQTAIVLSPEALAALKTPAAERTEPQQLVVAAAVLGQRAGQGLAELPPQEMVYAAAAVAENERGTIRYEKPREIRVLKRGDLEQPRQEVGPGALTAVTALEARFPLPAGHDESARRAALALWLIDPANPLTWRSMANRVWHFHFGRGLSDTPNDFGRMGSEPTHPQLLDWLACDLREHKSLKRLHRLICSSATYRRSSACSEEMVRLDPDNRLLARGSRRRLDADAIRDAILSTSGRLDLTMGGPGDQHFSQKPGPQLTPVLNYDDVDWDAPGMTRRSIYRVVWRGIPDPFFDAFDFPDLGLLVAARGESVSPLQSLVLLNNRFVLHHADAVAADIASDTAAAALLDQLREAVRRTWLREPTPQELAELEPIAATHGLAAVCRLLFNSNAFLYVE